MERKDCSILGAGWFGRALGEDLADRGWTVRGSTTRTKRFDELRESGIEPFLIRLEDSFEARRADEFLDTGTLVLSIPPARTDDRERDHRRQIEALLEAVEESPVEWVVMTGSTSVYPSANRVVDETDAGLPDKESGRAVWAAERLLRASPIAATVLRFGGLYGYGRHPANHLAGRSGMTHGGRPVNLVHRDDCVGAARSVLEADARDTAFNVVADEHPPRAEIYSVVAERQGLQPPQFADRRREPFKIVANRRIRERLEYEFVHPDPIRRAP